MRLDPNPLFRRAIVPWHDSTLTCWVVMVAMVVNVLFSWAGIVVALAEPLYHSYLWVPVTLLMLSLLVCFSIAFRLLGRYVNQGKQVKEQ